MPANLCTVGGAQLHSYTLAQFNSGTVAHCAEALKEEERSVWLQKSRNPCWPVRLYVSVFPHLTHPSPSLTCSNSICNSNLICLKFLPVLSEISIPLQNAARDLKFPPRPYLKDITVPGRWLLIKSSLCENFQFAACECSLRDRASAYYGIVITAVASARCPITIQLLQSIIK